MSNSIAWEFLPIAMKKALPGSMIIQKFPNASCSNAGAELMTLQAGISKKRNRSLIGQSMRVLMDMQDSRGSVGRLYSQAPDIDGIVRIRSEASPGELLDVTITGAGEYDLTARPVQQ